MTQPHQRPTGARRVPTDDDTTNTDTTANTDTTGAEQAHAADATEPDATHTRPMQTSHQHNRDQQVRDDDDHDAESERSSVLRVPTFSAIAPLMGWIVAWGAIAIASSILQRTSVPTGLNLGIADGGPGDDGFWAGVWALIVSGGAFLVGGYAAARIARANGTRHAVLVWVIAMIATVADTIYEGATDGTDGVVRLINGVPFWSDTGLTTAGERVLVLAIFAGISFAGALIGGGLGQTANRVERTDDAIVRS